MSDTVILGGRNTVTTVTDEGQWSFSWGAAFAGALIATAVSFILISLGTGIGFLAASPYSSGPSAATLTIGGAVWIVAAQIWGFAVGGYFAGRLRSRAILETRDDSNFRDGTHGLVAWALGVVATATMVAVGAMLAAGLTAHVGATVGAGAAAGGGAAAAGAMNQSRGGADTTSYYIDMLFRNAPPAGMNPQTAQGGQAPQANQAAPSPGQTTASGPLNTTSGGAPASSPQGETPPPMQTAQSNQTTGQSTTQWSPPDWQSRNAALDAQSRTEVGRIMATNLASDRMSDADRLYLSRLVAERTGIPPEEADRRITEADQQIREAAKAAADKASKAAAMLSFWTFMALLMGGAAAVVGAIVGGNQRDEELAAAARA